jgi:imidazolonepropionase-like amidohydrolase
MRRDPAESRVEPFERARIPIGTPEDARRVVDSLAGLELDHLKIRTVENRETYLALNAAADAHGLRVTGHAPGGPGLVLEAGQDGVDHGFYVPLDTVPRERRMAWWRELAARDVGVVPTLIVLETGLAGRSAVQTLVDDTTAAVHPLRPYVSRFMLLDWREQVLEASDERRAALERVLSIVLRQLREMREAGVRVMAGSDVAVVGIFPGASLHDELRLFVDSLGMTPLEALRSATQSPAAWLGLADSVGTIEAGKVADLVLLEGNPLASIRNTKRIAGVMLRGVWYDRAGLDRLLAAIKAMPDLRENDWMR